MLGANINGDSVRQLQSTAVLLRMQITTRVSGDGINVHDLRKENKEPSIKDCDHADFLTKPVDAGSKVMRRVF